MALPSAMPPCGPAGAGDADVLPVAVGVPGGASELCGPSDAGRVNPTTTSFCAASISPLQLAQVGERSGGAELVRYGGQDRLLPVGAVENSIFQAVPLPHERQCLGTVERLVAGREARAVPLHGLCVPAPLCR